MNVRKWSAPFSKRLLIYFLNISEHKCCIIDEALISPTFPNVYFMREVYRLWHVSNLFDPSDVSSSFPVLVLALLTWPAIPRDLLNGGPIIPRGCRNKRLRLIDQFINRVERELTILVFPADSGAMRWKWEPLYCALEFFFSALHLPFDIQLREKFATESCRLSDFLL